MDLFIRVTLCSEFMRPAYSSLSEVCDKLLIYEHSRETGTSAKETHVHMYMTGCKVSTDTLKNTIKRHAFTTGSMVADTRRGNGFWSFATQYKKEPVTSGCIPYMTKGKLDPVLNKGFTQEEIDTHKSAWVDITPLRKGTLTQYLTKPETQKESKMRQQDLITEIRRRYKIQRVGNFNTPVEDRPSELQNLNKITLINLIRQVVVVENKTILGRYKYRDYFDTILAIEEPNHYQTKLNEFMNFPIKFLG